MKDLREDTLATTGIQHASSRLRQTMYHINLHPTAMKRRARSRLLEHFLESNRIMRSEQGAYTLNTHSRLRFLPCLRCNAMLRYDKVSAGTEE